MHTHRWSNHGLDDMSESEVSDEVLKAKARGIPQCVQCVNSHSKESHTRRAGPGASSAFSAEARKRNKYMRSKDRSGEVPLVAMDFAFIGIGCGDLTTLLISSERVTGAVECAMVPET